MSHNPHTHVTTGWADPANLSHSYTVTMACGHDEVRRMRPSTAAKLMRPDGTIWSQEICAECRTRQDGHVDEHMGYGPTNPCGYAGCATCYPIVPITQCMITMTCGHEESHFLRLDTVDKISEARSWPCLECLIAQTKLNTVDELTQHLACGVRTEDPKDIIIRTLRAEVERLADILFSTQGSGWNDLSIHAAAARALLARLDKEI